MRNKRRKRRAARPARTGWFRSLRAEPLEHRWLLATITENEPNDTLATATAYTASASDVLSGDVSTAGDVDIFRTNLTQGQRISVNPKNSNDGTFNPAFPPPVEILDAAGDLKSGWRTFTHSSFIVPADGTYYIRFHSDSAYGQFTSGYAPTVTVSNFSGLTENEPNDTLAESTVLTAPDYFRGSLSDAADVDVYAVDALADQSIVVQLTDAPQNNAAVRLFDAGNNLIASELTGLGLRAEVPADGTYYVQIAADNAAGAVTGQYVGFVSVHGNTVWSGETSSGFEAATAWSLDTTRSYAVGKLTSPTDVDVYTIDTTGLQSLRFDLAEDGSDELSVQNRIVTLYDAFGQPLQYSTNGSLNATNNTPVSQPGRFYLTVQATTETGLGPYAMWGQTGTSLNAQRDVPLYFIDFDEQEPHLGYEWVEAYKSPEAIPLIVGRFDAFYDIYDVDVTLTKPTDGSERVSNGIGDFGDIGAGGWGGGSKGTRRPQGNSVTSAKNGLSSFQGGGTNTLLHEAGHATGLPHARNVQAIMAYDNQINLNPVGSFYPFVGTDSRISQSRQLNERDYLNWATQAGRQATEVEPNDDRTGAQQLDPYFAEMQWEVTGNTTYDVAERVSYIVTGDFNGDNRPDVATADFDQDKVRVLFGQGDGTLGGLIVVDTGNLVWWTEPLAVGDFNADGRDDLVTANHGDRDISILLANASGSFQNATRIDLGRTALAPVVADLNGDTRLDIAVTTGGSRVAVLAGNGDGTFQAAVDYPIAGDADSLVAADFTGDDKPDLAAASNAANGVSVLVNQGDGTFGTSVDYPTGSAPYSVAAADFDDDNRIDLAVADRSESKVSILGGNGDGTFEAPIDIPLGFQPVTVHADDVDGNGTSDLLFGAFTNRIDVLLGQGDGTFSGPVQFKTGSSSLSVTTADFNGDTLPDMATANFWGDSVDVILGKPNDVRNDRVVMFGLIADANDVDYYQLSVAADQTFVFDIDAAEFQYPLDAMLTVYDADGNLLDVSLEARDGDSGLASVDPYLVYTFAEAGVYTIRVTGQKQTIGSYRLKITPGEALDDDGPRVIYAWPQGGDIVDSTRQLLFWVDDQLDPDTLTDANIVVQGATTGIAPGSAIFDPLSSLLIWAATSPLAVDAYTVTLGSGANGIKDLKGNQLDGQTDGQLQLPEVSGDGTPGGDFVTSFTINGTDTTPATVTSSSYRRHPYNRGLFTLNFNDKLDVASVQSADFVLRGTGPDAAFDTSDDRLVPLDVWYDTFFYSSRSRLYAYTRGVPDDGTYRVEATFLDAAGHTIGLSRQINVTSSDVFSGPAVVDVNFQPGSVSESGDLVAVDFSQAVDPATLTTANFRLRHSADTVFFNADDSFVDDADGTIAWDPVNQRATLQPQFSLQDGYYLLELNGDPGGIADVQGRLLDGEFLDSFIQGGDSPFLWQDAPSGDGAEGGDYRAYFSIYTDTMPRLSVEVLPASIAENGGTATVTVRRENLGDLASPLTVTLTSTDPSEATLPAQATIPANQASVDVTVTGVDDDLLDGTRQVSLVAEAAGFVDGVAELFVTDHETLSLEIAAEAISEVGGSTTATVTRNNVDIGEPLTVYIFSSDTDEAVAPASVTIPADAASASFTIDGVADALLDGVQVVTFTVTATGYEDGTDTVSVTDHETLVATFSAAEMSEQGGSVNLTITRAVANPAGALTVDLANSDATEADVPASVVIPAGEASITLTVNAVDDTLLDGTRTVTVTASAAGYQPASAAVDVTDYETVTLEIDGSTFAENAGSTTAVLRRSNTDNSSDLTVTLASTDITAATVPDQVTIPGGQSSTSFAITLVDDTLLDGTQPVQVSATAAGYVGDAHDLSVTDYETLALTIDQPFISENGGLTGATVSRSNTDLGQPLTVQLNNDDPGEADVPLSVVIPAGASAVDFTIQGVDDDLQDGIQTVTLTASAAGYVGSTDTVDVIDQESLILTLSEPQMSESGGSLTLTVTRAVQAPDLPLEVSLASQDLTELTVPDTVTIPAGETSATVTLTAVDDDILDGTQVVPVTATATDYVATQITVDVTDHETLELTIAQAEVREDENGTTATVRRNNTDIAQPQIVYLSSSDTSEATVPTEVTIPANQQQVTFNVTVVDDTLLDGTVTVMLSADSPGYVGAQAGFGVADHESLAVTTPGNSVREDSGSLVGTVTRSNTDTGSPLTIDLASSDVTEITVPEQVVIPADAASTEFTITVINDRLLDGSSEATVTASASGYQDGEVRLLVSDASKLGIQVAADPISESGGTATATVSRDNTDIDLPLTVQLSVSDTTEVSVPDEVTIPAAAASTTFTVEAVDDDALDGMQTVNVIARATGYVDGRTQVSVADHEQLLVLPEQSSISELDGSTIVRIERPNTDVDDALTVSLTSSNPDRASLPQYAVIPAGQAATEVFLYAIDDDFDREHPPVVITATAEGYVDGSGQVDVVNDDQAGLSVSAISGTTTEEGDTATFRIELTSAPFADVIITLRSSDETEGTVSPETLMFSPVNWGSVQIVTVTGVDDHVDDDNVGFQIEFESVVSNDTDYNDLDVDDVTVINVDDDTAGITVSPVNGQTTEAGGTDTFSVVLDSEPTSDVSIYLYSDDLSEGMTSLNSLTFTAADWDTPQVITVTGQNDDIDDGDVVYTIVTEPATSSDGKYDDLDADNVEMINLDDDLAGITVSAISGDTTEAGGTATFSIVLDSQPTADVTIVLNSSDASEGSPSPQQVTFTAADWDLPQTVTVTGIDDHIDDGDVNYAIATAPATSNDLNYQGRDAADVVVTNLDDDSAGITVTAISGNTTEAGGTASFSIVLDTQPTATVTLNVASSNVDEGTVPSEPIVFTPASWDTPQVVTVTGVDDDVDDGDADYSITIAAASSPDPDYAGIDPADIDVVNLDDDTAGITVGPLSGDTSEAGDTANFSVVLDTEPTANVTIAVASNDPTEGSLSASQLTFTPGNWDTPQFVTVTGVDDFIIDGDINFTVVVAAAASADDNYDGLDPGDVAVTNTDDDVAQVIVSAISGPTTESGDSATFSVVLASRPTVTVTVYLDSSDASEGTVSTNSLVFAPAAWDTPQFVTVTGVDDRIDDGDVAYRVEIPAVATNDVHYRNLDPADVAVINLDDDTAGIVVTSISGNTGEDGTAATFSVVLNSEPTADVSIAINSADAGEGVAAPQMLTFTAANWDTPQVVDVMGVDDFVDDGDVAYVVQTAPAASGDPVYDGMDADDVSVTNIDNDTAGIVVSAISNDTSEAGVSAEFSVVLESEPTANVAIAISSGDTGEGTVSPDTLIFTSGNWDVPQLVSITGVDDDLDDGDIGYDIVIGAATSEDGDYDGLDPGDLSLINLDDDTAGITVSEISGNTSEAGGTATFTIVLNTEPITDVTVPLLSDDPGEGTLSAASVTFTPYDWDTPQEVTVTGEDDLVVDGDMAYSIITGAAASSDPMYSQLDPADVSLINTDDDTASVIVSTIGGDTTEAGDNASFTVLLGSQPTGTVQVDLVSSDTSEGIVAPDSIFFGPGNWDAPQTVTVTGVDDDVDDGDVQYTVVTTVTSVSDPVYDGLPADDVTVWNLDDDTAAIFVSSISGDTSETGTTATFSLVLGSEPTAEVTIGVSSDDTSEGSLAVTSVIFTPANWDVAQMITVTGVDDDLDDGDIGYQILTAAAASLDTVYDGMDPDDVAVTNRDDQSDGLSWQNPIHPCDINNDGFITVADILVLITDINSNGTRQLPMPPTPPNAPPPYLDPSGDDAVTPEDILVVINYINENGPGPVVPLGTGDSGDGFSPGTPGLPDGEGEGPVDLSQRTVAAAARPTTGETGLSSPRARSQDDPPGTTGWLDPRSTANAPTPITRPDLRPEPVPSFRSTDEDHASDHRSERNVDLLMTTGGDDDLAFVGESELDGTLADIADHVNRV